MRRRWSILRILAACLAWALAVGGAFAQPADRVLARVNLAGPLTGFPLRVHAHLQDGAGTEYVLVSATAADLAAAGRPYSVLDAPAVPNDYMLATKRTDAARALPAGGFPVVHDDGRHWLLLAPGTEAEPLAELGFALRRLPAEPIVLAPRTPAAGTSSLALRTLDAAQDALVRDLVTRVQTNRLHALMRRLTGVEATVADGDFAVIPSRRTNSGAHIRRATQEAYDQFRALGLNPAFHAWSAGGYSGRNIVADQTGATTPGEIVVVVAHIDDQPNTTNAPGADDNASGSAAVLLGAGLLRQYRFERTVRFLLVTGEEQGLYGSAAYAAARAAAGDNIVAVFNMDMIAWDGDGDGALDLHTRLAGNPGYASDLVIASAFTNAVAKYGFTGLLRPEIVASGDPDSDHASFWDEGYPAVLAIEDYDDFNPNYHTTADTLASLAARWSYFVRFVQASLATVADLARPVSRVPFDALQVASATAAPANGIGAGAWAARHEGGATESGADGLDLAWSALPANTNARLLKVASSPYGSELGFDARPTNSATMFGLTLSASNSAGGGFACTNRLRFDFLTPPESNRTWLIRIRVDGRYTAGGAGYDGVADLRAVADAGGWFALPPLANLSNGVAFGACDVAARFVDRGASNCAFAAAAMNGSSPALETLAQMGTRVRDEVEVSTNLLGAGGWMPAGTFTNDVPPGAATFDSGFDRVPRTPAAPALTNAPARYFRLRRNWLAP